MTTDGLLSDASLDSLRCTAALLVVAPGLRARVGAAGSTLFDVARPSEGPGHEETALLPACTFHSAVARAQRGRRAGERIAMAGLPPGIDPEVELTPVSGDLVLPGPMLRLRREGRWWHVVAVPVPLAEAVAALSAGPGVAVRPDNDLGVTLLHVTTPAGDEAASGEAIDALLTAVGRVGVADLAARLGAGPAVPSCPDVPALPAHS